MTLETKEAQTIINEQEANTFRDQLSPSVLYLQRLSVLKDTTLAAPVAQRNVVGMSEQMRRHVDEEYAILESAFGAAPLRGSLYINDGLYSHAVSLEGEGVKTTTARIQTPDQMIASLMMVVDSKIGTTEYSPFSFSALARTLRGIPLVNRTRVTESGAVTEVYFREPRGNERVDLFNFAKKLKIMADTGIGAQEGYAYSIVDGNIKLTIPTDRLLQAETYKTIQPFAAGLAFSSKDGRHVRQYDLSTSVLSDAPDEDVFTLLRGTERQLIPTIHETTAIPEETTDLLTLSGELRNNIKDLLKRFILHERNTVRTKRDGFMQLAHMLMEQASDSDGLAALQQLLQDGKKPNAKELLKLTNSTLAELLDFVLGRARYFSLHEGGIQIFEDAKDQMEELYPVHTGYALIYALERAHKQFKDLSGKNRIDYDDTNSLKNYGKHPDYRTTLDLRHLNGPQDLVSLDEALAAINLPIDRVRELIAASDLAPTDQRQLDILTAIHRAPVIAGFSTLFDMIAFTEYGNALDINAGSAEPIEFQATVNALFDQNVFITIENTGQSPSEKVVDQINDPAKRSRKIGVDSDHGGSGEALVLVKQLMNLLNHTRTETPDTMTFYAGYRKYAQKGFRVRTGFQSI